MARELDEDKKIRKVAVRTVKKSMASRYKFDRPARDAEEIAAAHVPKRGPQLLNINSLTHRR